MVDEGGREWRWKGGLVMPAEIYKKASDQGYAEAAVDLAILYLRGSGVPQDYKEAVRLYRRAAALGSVNAMNNLGHCYEDGTGVQRSLKKARKWYEKAVAAGHVSAGIALSKVMWALSVCSYCGKGKDELPPGSKLMTCGRCRNVLYCSQPCQKQDWKMHKLACKKRNDNIVIE